MAGCEASLLSIKRADIFDSLEQVNKDALVIYDFLKTDSRQHGHTQISLDRLKQKLEKECPDFDDAMKFLKRNKVVKETEIEHDPKVCLQQLWNYERKISEGIRDLYKKQCEDPMELEVDLNWFVPQEIQMPVLLYYFFNKQLNLKQNIFFFF